MALDLTTRTRRALQDVSIEPNIIVRFEGLDIAFSTLTVKEFIRINDPGFFLGAEGYFVGGLFDLEPEKNRTILDGQSTSFSIQQQMNYDEGTSSSVSQINVGLIDEDQFVSALVSPGQLIDDMLGRQVQVYVTFGSVSFFEDAILVFKGIVSAIDSGAGIIKFKVNHPDTKKKANVFKSVETRLVSNINSTQVSFDVEDASSFFMPQGSLKTYLRVGTELIRYTTISGNTISGMTRGSLGSTAVAHNAEEQVKVVYALEGNPLDLALELMMSGFGSDPVYENISITNFRQIGSSTLNIARAIYFEGVRLIEEYGVQIGDTITITGAANGANNGTFSISNIVRTESGYYILVSSGSFVLETGSSAVMATFTQYNTLPDGLRMKPDEVDIEEHLKIKNFFHSATQFRLFIKEDAIEGKEFIDDQLYKPIACYALPRKAQASVGYTVGPIPGEDIVTLDITNIKDPRRVTISRSSARSFFNEVVYKYDDTPLLDEERFTSGQIFISETSKNRIKGVNRTFVIESQGLRSDLNANNIIGSNANRILDRYKFGAETVSLKTLLRDSAGIEIGDIVIADLSEIQTTDISKGNRDFEPRLFEVQNKTINLKTGDVELSLLDTGLNINTRFGLMSPTSNIAGVISQSQFVINAGSFYSAKFGLDEFVKWSKLISPASPLAVRIFNPSRSINESAVVIDVTDNTFTLRQPATVTLTAGLGIEFTDYDNVNTSVRQKLVFGYMTNDANFADGGFAYSML